MDYFKTCFPKKKQKSPTPSTPSKPLPLPNPKPPQPLQPPKYYHLKLVYIQFKKITTRNNDESVHSFHSDTDL